MTDLMRREVEARTAKPTEPKTWMDAISLKEALNLQIEEISADYRAIYVTAFNDSLIATTAKLHNLTVETRNTTDFAQIGINFVNPWNFKE